jgi:hypothetical protein
MRGSSSPTSWSSHVVMNKPWLTRTMVSKDSRHNFKWVIREITASRYSRPATLSPLRYLTTAFACSSDEAYHGFVTSLSRLRTSAATDGKVTHGGFAGSALRTCPNDLRRPFGEACSQGACLVSALLSQGPLGSPRLSRNDRLSMSSEEHLRHEVIPACTRSDC